VERKKSRDYCTTPSSSSCRYEWTDAGCCALRAFTNHLMPKEPAAPADWTHLPAAHLPSSKPSRPLLHADVDRPGEMIGDWWSYDGKGSSRPSPRERLQISNT